MCVYIDFIYIYNWNRCNFKRLRDVISENIYNWRLLNAVHRAIISRSVNQSVITPWYIYTLWLEIDMIMPIICI